MHQKKLMVFTQLLNGSESMLLLFLNRHKIKYRLPLNHYSWSNRSVGLLRQCPLLVFSYFIVQLPWDIWVCRLCLIGKLH